MPVCPRPHGTVRRNSFSAALGASRREAAARLHKLADGRIQHGKRLPHGAVELRLAGRDGRKARRTGSASRRAAAPPPPRRSAFSKHVFPPLLGKLRIDHLRRMPDLFVNPSVWKVCSIAQPLAALCRLTDASMPLRVHKVQLHFPNLAFSNLSPSALVDQFRLPLIFRAPLISLTPL